MRKIEIIVFVVISAAIFTMGVLLFFGKQSDISYVPEASAIDSLVEALENGKDISKPELVALLKIYSKEAKSGQKTVIFFAEFMRFIGPFLWALVILQLAILFKVVSRSKG